MRRVLKVLGVGVAVLFVALVVNAAFVSGETKRATVTVDGAELVDTSEGTVQVLDEGDPADPTIVLVHCYACSTRWWDQMAPLLAEEHRVIRLDLMGHGGSAKPSGDHYSMEAQARVVLDVMNHLDVRRATLVGHSLGGAVVTAVGETNPRRVRRLVIIDTVTRSQNAELASVAELAYKPVVGQAIKRWIDTVPASWNVDEYGIAFAPGFDIGEGFDEPDQPVLDAQAMTYGAFQQSHDGFNEYVDAVPLDERLVEVGRPALVIFGDEEQIAIHADADLRAYRRVPGTTVEVISGVGHSPQVEDPERTAQLLLGFIESTR